MLILNEIDIEKILEDSKNIAVVGCSNTEGKAAHDVPRFLQQKGYKIIPVNPYSEEILGEKAYDSLKDVEEKIDIVNIFRPSEEAYGIVEEAMETDANAIWMQLGIEKEKEKKISEEEGLKVIQRKCMKIQYRKIIEN